MRPASLALISNLVIPGRLREHIFYSLAAQPPWLCWLAESSRRFSSVSCGLLWNINILQIDDGDTSATYGMNNINIYKYKSIRRGRWWWAWWRLAAPPSKSSCKLVRRGQKVIICARDGIQAKCELGHIMCTANTKKKKNEEKHERREQRIVSLREPVKYAPRNGSARWRS